MECQVEKKHHFPLLLPCAFNRGLKPPRLLKRYVPCTIKRLSERTTQQWFSKFKNDSFDSLRQVF